MTGTAAPIVTTIVISSPRASKRSLKSVPSVETANVRLPPPQWPGIVIRTRLPPLRSTASESDSPALMIGPLMMFNAMARAPHSDRLIGWRAGRHLRRARFRSRIHRHFKIKDADNLLNAGAEIGIGLNRHALRRAIRRGRDRHELADP